MVPVNFLCSGRVYLQVFSVPGVGHHPPPAMDSLRETMLEAIDSLLPRLLLIIIYLVTWHIPTWLAWSERVRPVNLLYGSLYDVYGFVYNPNTTSTSSYTTQTWRVRPRVLTRFPQRIVLLGHHTIKPFALQTNVTSSKLSVCVVLVLVRVLSC